MFHLVADETPDHPAFNVLVAALPVMRSRGFRVRCGSLGFRRRGGGVYWIRGGPHHETVADFENDWHCWFERADGAIADIDWDILVRSSYHGHSTLRSV